MQGLGLVQLAPCLHFFTRLIHCHYLPFVLPDPGMWKGNDTGGVTIYTQVAKARSTINQEHETAMSAKATTAQNPLYSAQILACRCTKVPNSFFEGFAC